MLKSTVSSNNDVKLDTYSKLIAYLKRMSDGFKPKKSKVFSVKNVETFLNEAPDKVFLAVKVALIFGVHGACRGNELLKITVDDIENHSDDLLLVKLTDTKTKIDRSFVIRGEYKTRRVQKYLDLRPADMKTNRFFIRYQNGKCFKQVMGKNKISNMPQEIASYLMLPDIKLYTGHCFRRTSATLLADSGADLTVLKRHGGWKSNVVAEGYIEDSIENKGKTCERIMENIKLQPSVNPSMPLSPRPSTSKQRDSPSHFPENEPDSDIISNTQNIKSTTIFIPNKIVTINFHNGVGNCQSGAVIVLSITKRFLYEKLQKYLNNLTMTNCCVPNCSENGTHQFPKDEKVKKLWLKAIRRVNFVPKSGSRLCRNHFRPSDYLMLSKYTGVEHQHKHLKKSAVPSVFSWNSKPVSKLAAVREERLKARNLRKCLFPNETALQCTVNILPSYESGDGNVAQNVEILTSEDLSHQNCSITCITNSIKSQETQTSNILRMFSTDLLLTDNESVNFYTGLETYQKFSLVLSTLMPMANDLKYRWSRVISLSIEDQFLMLLMKLRRNKPDFELGKMFGVSKTEVSNVVTTWINFVYDLWSLIDIWPSRELVNFYMPNTFKNNNTSTRIIIDGTEIPIQKPSQPDAQKASFSQYKHKNTLKILVGSSPGGMFTYCSGAYAGSTSDRQIVERSNLLERCEPGDSIMADRGFNVQDLFAGKGVGINIPTFLKGRSQIPGLLLKQDQKLARQRVHIERLIGLTKTYKILTSELNQCYVPLASKIFYICMMLCNFREKIVNINKLK